MPSVPSPEDPILSTAPSAAPVMGLVQELPRPRPGLRVAAVLAVAGGLIGTAQAQDTFDGESGTGSDFNDATNWVGDVYPGDAFGGNTIIFDLPDSDPFEILIGGDITGLGGLDNTADNADITFSPDGGSFTFDPTAIIDTGTGSFQFDIGVDFLGDVTFTLNTDGSMTFTETVTFGTDGGAGGVATFDSGSAAFRGAVTLWQDYDLSFDNGAAVAFGDVSFEGAAHDLIFNDTGAGGTFAEVIFGGDVTFVDGAVLTVTGGSEGTANFSGSTSLAGAFTLIVDGDQTVSFSGTTEFGGAFTIDTSGGGGNATVTLGGTFDLAAGLDDIAISITTDGTDDDVSISGNALRGFTSTITAEDGSAFRFTEGNAGDGGTSVVLGSGSTLLLGASAGLQNEFLLASLDDLDATVGTGSVELDGDEDATIIISGGTYSGSFTDTGNGDLSVAWTQNESRYLGTSTFDGAYQVGNEGTHYFGTFVGAGDPGNIRAGVDGLSSFDILQATAYLENGDMAVDSIDGSVTLTSGATATAMLFIENDSTLTANGDFSMNANSVVKITGSSASGVNLNIGGEATIDGLLRLTATSAGGAGTENAVFEGASTVSGTVRQSNSSFVRFGDDLAIQTGGSWLLEDTAIGRVDGNLSVAGLLSLSGTSADGLIVGDSVTVFNGGQVVLTDDRELAVAFDFTVETGGLLRLEDTAAMVVDGDFTTNGTVELRNSSEILVVGAWNQAAGSSVFDGPTVFDVGSVVIADGATMEFRDSGGATSTINVLTGDMVVDTGGLLFGNGTINFLGGGDLEYGGTVMAGANGATEGLLEIATGDLVSQVDGELHFGLTGDLVMDVTDNIGQSSIISVTTGVADFSNSGRMVVDVQGSSYIPTDRTFTLLEATSFINEDNIDLEVSQVSVTRSWDWGVDALGMLGNRVYAQSDANYTNTLTGQQLQIGNLLNSFIPKANLDPSNQYGQLLGQLDQIQTAAGYQAAITGLEPTAQISAIQVTALGQYHEVLRREIRSRYVEAERRTPTPFRLGQPMQLLSADDGATTRTIRRASNPDTTAEGFGAFWTRDLRTPTEGNVVGLDGNEYGGFGAFAWELSDSVVAGIDLGYSAFTGNLDRGYGNTRIGTLRGGGFATWSNGDGLFLDGALSGAWNHYDFTRLVPGTDLYALSNADGLQLDASIGGGYRMEMAEGFAFTPTASVLYSYIDTGDIDENSDTVAALSIDPGTLSSFIGRAGAGVSWSALPGLIIDGEAGWQGNFTDNGNYNVGLSGLGADVPVEVKNQTINTAYYGAGVSWAPTSNVEVNLNWQGRSGDGLHSSMFFGGVSISF